MPQWQSSRRRLLRGFGSAATAVLAAGCGGDGTGEDPTSTTTSTASGTRTPTDTGSPALDLREANVVGVSFDRQDGQYAFDVSLHHDDEGEDGYANWWQVERLDGTRLGRRELLHAHSRQPFTRSATVEIPDAVGCVVVRGHDQTHAYGGVAVLVDLESGETRSIDQGTERQSVDASDCPG